VDLEQRRQLLEKVAARSAFQSSPTLHNLLLFLWEESVVKGDAELREHDIGVRVFGRRPDYDTAVDNIVRVQVSKLRKRLEEYFAGEGRLDPQVIEIPRGHYALIFR